MYRPWDGLAIAGPFSVGVSSGVASATNAQGLPTLELSIDSEGYIVAHRPDASPDKNGVAGEGKVFSGAELQASNSAMIGAASRYAGYELPFIAQVPLGNSLKVLEPTFFTGDYLQGKTSHSQMQASYSYLLPYLTIESALIDSVPQLNFSGSTVTLKNGTVLPNLNNRLVSEILELPATSNAGSDGNCYHYYTSVDAKSGSEKVVPYSLKAGSGIAGTFAAFYAPDPTCAPEGRGLAKPDANAQNDRFDGNSDALVWGKSEGGQNIIVHVHAFNYTIDRLVELVQSLPIK